MQRRFRLLAAVGMAMVLSTFMIYTALSGDDVREPVLQAHELASHAEVATRETVQLDGVAAGPVEGERGQRMTFFVTDRKGSKASRTKVVYEGSVPDAFRVGRHVIVKGRLADSAAGARTFEARPDSLVTKCPSKFEAEGGSSRSTS